MLVRVLNPILDFAKLSQKSKHGKVMLMFYTDSFQENDILLPYTTHKLLICSFSGNILFTICIVNCLHFYKGEISKNK